MRKTRRVWGGKGREVARRAARKKKERKKETRRRASRRRPFFSPCLKGPPVQPRFCSMGSEKRTKPLGSRVFFSSTRKKSGFERPATSVRRKRRATCSREGCSAAAAISHGFSCFFKVKISPLFFLTHPKNMASVTIASASSEGVLGHASAMTGGACLCETPRPR